MQPYLAICLAATLLGASAIAAEIPWRNIVTGTQTESQALATRDLQRYLAQASGAVPEILSVESWTSAPCPAVIVGTLAANPLLKSLTDATKDLGEEGYYLANQNINGKPVVVVAAKAPEGVVNGIYGLLRELRFGFFLGSESVPDGLPDRLPASPVVRRPVFAIRGVLPWYNFFNSPTTWDPIDHRAFVDQLIRSGANFVGFHSYDTEPFAAYDDHGAMK